LAVGQIDDEIELGRLLDWQISARCPTQNLAHVFGGAPEKSCIVGSRALSAKVLMRIRLALRSASAMTLSGRASSVS
jgi:hypothetical protein